MLLRSEEAKVHLTLRSVHSHCAIFVQRLTPLYSREDGQGPILVACVELSQDYKCYLLDKLFILTYIINIEN